MKISLPGSSLCSRCHVLSARRSSPERDAEHRQRLQRAAVSCEAGDGLVERRGSFRAVSAPHLTIDEIDRKLGIVGQPSHQLLQGRGGLWLVAQLVVQRGHPTPDLDVARRRRQRGARRRERAIEIAQGVPHAPQHVPFDGAGRAFQLARQLGERPAAARDREGDRPDRAPALGVARWKLAKQRGEGGGYAGAVAGSAAGDPQARGAQRELQLGGGVARAAAAPPGPRPPRWVGPRAPARRRGARRSRRAAGSARASSRSSAMLFSCASLSGASPERARIASAASMRRRRADGLTLELQGVVVRRQRGGIVACGGQRACTAGDRGHGLRREAYELVVRLDRRLRLTERGQQVRVGGERRVGGAAARGRRALGACAETIAQPRPTGVPASLTRRRARSSSSGRSSSARSARSSSAVESVRRTSQSARAGSDSGEGHEQGRNERQTPHTRKIAPPEPAFSGPAGP